MAPHWMPVDTMYGPVWCGGKQIALENEPSKMGSPDDNRNEEWIESFYAEFDSSSDVAVRG